MRNTVDAQAIVYLICAPSFSETITQHAKYLGIDPDTEEHLLYIAEQALMAPLPEGTNENHVCTMHM